MSVLGNVPASSFIYIILARDPIDLVRYSKRYLEKLEHTQINVCTHLFDIYTAERVSFHVYYLLFILDQA